ncbi:MAG: hypothetical protein V4564_02180 [Pseudomonadota bacterium]
MDTGLLLLIGVPLALVVLLFVRAGRKGELRLDHLWFTLTVVMVGASAMALQWLPPIGTIGYRLLSSAASLGMRILL